MQKKWVAHKKEYIMQANERRAGRDRRSADCSRSAEPFLTKDGLIFTDRRRGDRVRRHLDVNELIELGDVEEIVLEPVRYG